MINPPTGIIRTLPTLYRDPKNPGWRGLSRSLERCKVDDTASFYIALAQQPKQDVLDLYIVIGNEVMFRCNIAGYSPARKPSAGTRAFGSRRFGSSAPARLSIRQSRSSAAASKGSATRRTSGDPLSAFYLLPFPKMSQYRVTYQHRDRELTKDVTAFSEEEARAVFKHNFRGIAPTSVERIEFAQERKPAPAKSQPRRPFRRHGSDQEFRGIADGLRRFREKMAEASKG